jgi:hypothetical protein
MRIKPGVKLAGVQPQLFFAATIVENELFPVIVTSGVGGNHRFGSDHYKGCAVDLRSKHLELSDRQKQDLAVDVEDVLGDEFLCLFEGAGTPNEHFHLAWRP